MSSIVTAASASAAGGKRRIVYVDSLATSFSLSFCVSGTTRRTRAKLVAGSEELMAHTNTV